MPTVNYVTLSTGNAGPLPAHEGEPWIIQGSLVTSRTGLAPLIESSASEVNGTGSVAQSWIDTRLISVISTYTPLGDADKALVSVSPDEMYYSATPATETIAITFPDDDRWGGATVQARQYFSAPVGTSYTTWLTGGAIAYAVPGPFSRSFRTLKMRAIGSYFFPLWGFEWDFNGTTETVDAIAYPYSGRYYSAILTREFGNSTVVNGPVRLRAIGENGYKSAWTAVRFNPCANGVIQQLDNEVISVDGTESFDPDGTVVEWIWNIGTNFTVGPTSFSYTTPTATIPVSSIPGPWRDGLAVTAELRVRDNEGLLSLPVPMSFIYRTIPPPMGMIDDAAGQIFTVVNLAENVAVSKFTGGMATRELIYTIPNAKNPSYTYNARNNTHYVSYESREDGTQKVARSIDGGATWL